MQRCQTGIVEEETSKYATGGKPEPSAILSSSDEAVDETEIDAFESRSGCSCKKIILRYETTQSRQKLNSERRGTTSFRDVKKRRKKKNG